MRDGVTGLLNRSAVEELAAERLNSAEGQESLCILLDVDDFKHINDQRGHVFGDQVLREVSEVLRRSCRMNDLAGRVGGDEFFIMLCGVSDGVIARQRMQKILAAVREKGARLGVPRLSVSMGAVRSQPGDRSFLQIYSRADEALYTAKRHGKDRAELK